MFTRPKDLTDDDIVRVVAEGWSIDAEHVEYAAVGFGSHHWHVRSGADRWFLNVDDLDARRIDATETRSSASNRLRDALTIARTLHDAGLEFVVAPMDSPRSHVIHPITDRYVGALYPYVDGEHHPFGPYPSHDARLAVLDRLVQVHSMSCRAVAFDGLEIPGRDQLDIVLVGCDTEWGPGPYAAAARALLEQHRDELTRTLAHFDVRVDALRSSQPRTVITHGEPHRANTIDTAHGVMLIDWDTALNSPPERDLWMLIEEDPAIADAYTERTGVAVNHDTVALYRRWWDLCEISLFVAEFIQPHEETEDTRVAWAGLQRFLDPTRWSDPNRLSTAPDETAGWTNEKWIDDEPGTEVFLNESGEL